MADSKLILPLAVGTGAALLLSWRKSQAAPQATSSPQPLPQLEESPQLTQQQQQLEQPEQQPEQPFPPWEEEYEVQLPPWEEGYTEEERREQESPKVEEGAPKVEEVRITEKVKTESIPNASDLLPRLMVYSTSEVKVKVIGRYVQVNAAASGQIVFNPESNYRIVSVSPVIVTSDFYSESITVQAYNDSEETANLVLTGKLNFSTGAFKDGTGFNVLVTNGSTSVIKVTIQVLFIQIAQTFYEDKWAPLAEKLFLEVS